MKNESINWIIDTQIIKENQLNEIRNTIINNGFKSIELNLEKEKMISVDATLKYIPYGTTFLIKECLKNLSNYHLFFNDENFSPKKWNEYLKDKMLNHDAQFCQLKDVFSLNLPESIFIKPNSDLKSFTGSIVKKDGLERFYKKVQNKEGFNFDLSLPIVINSVKNTGWEWRLFMINNEIIGSSSYKLKEMLNLNKGTPEEVKKFAIECSYIWQPEEIYVIDVCESDSGYKIVEFNCFHASGLYNCNIPSIFKKVSDYILSKN